MNELRFYKDLQKVLLKPLDSMARLSLKVGRSSDNDVVLTESYVSREHFVVERREDKWIVKNLSRFGTWVNKKNIDHEIELQDHSEISLGDWKIVFRWAQQRKKVNGRCDTEPDPNVSDYYRDEICSRTRDIAEIRGYRTGDTQPG